MLLNVAEEKVHYYKLLKLSKSPTKVTEFLEHLLAPDSDHVQLIDGSNDYKTVCSQLYMSWYFLEL